MSEDRRYRFRREPSDSVLIRKSTRLVMHPVCGSTFTRTNSFSIVVSAAVTARFAVPLFMPTDFVRGTHEIGFVANRRRVRFD